MQVFPDYSTLCKLSKHVFGQSICKQWYEQIIDVPPERIPDSMVPFLWTGVLCEDQSPSVRGYSVICFTVQVLMPLSTTSNCKPFHCSPKRSSALFKADPTVVWCKLCKQFTATLLRPAAQSSSCSLASDQLSFKFVILVQTRLLQVTTANLISLWTPVLNYTNIQ